MDRANFSEQLTQAADVAGVALPGQMLDTLFRYVELLDRWNRKINITALPLNPPSAETLDRLLIEPLVIATKVSDGSGRWLDLGSGGGSPAIPMRLVLPGYALTMVESKSRKAAFLRECVRELGLTRTEVMNVRFERLPRHSELVDGVDLITARAVRVDNEFVALCALLLRNGGRFLPFGYLGGAPVGFEEDCTAGYTRRCST